MARLHREALIREVVKWARDNLHSNSSSSSIAADKGSGSGSGSGSMSGGRTGGECRQAVSLKTTAEEQVGSPHGGAG